MIWLGGGASVHGVALLSLLFGAAHLAKPNESAMDITSIVFFGLFWCFTRRRTASLWFAIGFHAMWDYAALALYAAPNTGNGGRSVPGHLLEITYDGPIWLTGASAAWRRASSRSWPWP